MSRSRWCAATSTRDTELPAANGIGEPRAVAAAYGAAVTGKLGLTDHTLAALVQPAQPPSDDPIDLILRIPAAYSLGYCKPVPQWQFGSTADTGFGTPGNGGSFGFADPDTGIGYCYAPNRLGFGLTDPRETALRDALHQRVLGERPQTRPRFSRTGRA